jgi:predicted TIM-barrel fold metal-dependent hydrolase
MQPDDMILISVDDHVIEPPDLFEGHVSAADKELAPRVERLENGSDVWVFEDAKVPNIALNAVAGRPPAEYNFEPTSFEDIRLGTYRIDERVRDMDVNGVLASLCFPSMTGFCGQLFTRAKDRDVSYRLLQAYNDWHVDEWCGTHPGRFIPLAIPPSWDPLLMAAEVQRMANKGCHAVTFSENPSKLGLPSYHSDHWDPFWAACQDTGTIVALHIGSSSQLIITADDAPVDVTITLGPINTQLAVADIIWSPVLRKFPRLRFALSEGGTGWIPYLLERIDYVYQHHRAWTHQDFGDMLPSQVFRERFVTCFIDDAVGIQLRNEIGIDSMTWECDYPHSDSTWPTSPELLAKNLAGLTDEEINKITHLNAMRHFNFDPFSVRPREQCTVGALRATAQDVDVHTISTGPSSKAKGATGSLADIAKTLTTGGTK